MGLSYTSRSVWWECPSAFVEGNFGPRRNGNHDRFYIAERIQPQFNPRTGERLT